MVVEPAATAAKIPAAMERAANAGGTLTRMAEAAPGAAMETMVIMVIPEISRPAARRKGLLYHVWTALGVQVVEAESDVGSNAVMCPAC
jgi:hypothetical protein